MTSRLTFAFIMLPLLASLAGCGAGGQAMPIARTGTIAQARAVEGAWAALTAMAKQGLATAEGTYKQFPLKASQKPLKAEKEREVIAGLRSVIATLEQVDAEIATAMAASLSEPGMRHLQSTIARMHPQPGTELAAEAGISELVYRIAQYRLKFGTLVETALRREQQD